MANCAVKLRKVQTVTKTAGKQKLNLASDFGELVGLDVSDTVVQLTHCEIMEQERIGNDPSNLVINNKPGTMIRIAVDNARSGSELVYKTSTFFGRAAEMRDAARDAHNLLRQLTRTRSGTARGAYHFYVGQVGSDSPGKYIGKSFAGFFGVSRNLTSDSTVTIIGPLTTYGRKLYWNPAGGKTVVKRFPGTRAARKNLGVQIKGGFIGTQAIHADVKKRMQRKVKYKALSFGDPFYVMSAGMLEGGGVHTMKRPLRMPAITIQVKARGRLR